MMNHEALIERTFELARRGIGNASPNPLVGAVLVKDSKIIGEGFHTVYGKPHAEVEAINSASTSVEGATLYCNLEPCCHTNKQTPPCVNLIIEKKIKEVVISNLDPNPGVSGKGVQILKDAGIKVTVGILEKQGAELNEVFFHYMKTGLPFVHLKWAQTLDGKIASASGDSKWISSEIARKEVHAMRLKYDAICVGKNTVNVDNPTLNIRMGLENLGKNPRRVILSSFHDLNLDSKVFKDEFSAETILITPSSQLNSQMSSQNEKVRPFLLAKGVEIIELVDSNDPYSIELILRELGSRKISSILVEGGSTVLSAFLNSGHFQRYSIYLSQKLLGNGPSFYVDNSRLLVENSLKLHGNYRQIGEQLVIEGIN